MIHSGVHVFAFVTSYFYWIVHIVVLRSSYNMLVIQHTKAFIDLCKAFDYLLDFYFSYI